MKKRKNILSSKLKSELVPKISNYRNRENHKNRKRYAEKS